MYVPAAGVHPANDSQWARVFRNQSYAHAKSQFFGIDAQVPGSPSTKPPAFKLIAAEA
jgi:hypothetical protein